MHEAKFLLKKRVTHQHWKTAFDEAFAMITFAQPGDVISVIGASRVGKTSMIKELIHRLFSTAEDDSLIMNYLTISASNFGVNGSFSSKSFMLQILDALKHPAFSIPEGELPKRIQDYNFTRTTEHALKLAVEKSFINKKVKYVFIDEAQHIKYTIKVKDSAAGTLDSWKCLAQNTGIILVVVGTYPLLESMRESPHFLGRKHQVHFRRYRNNSEDMKPFFEIIKTYEVILKGYCPNNLLIENAELLYKSSLGCVGHLKNILQRALSLSIQTSVPFTKELIFRCSHTENELDHMLTEIVLGECLIDPPRTVTNSSITRNQVIRGRPFQANPKRRTLNNRELGGN